MALRIPSRWNPAASALIASSTISMEGGDVQAGDVILKLTLRTLDEVETFTGFLTRFLEAAGRTADRIGGPVEPPFLMVSSQPWDDADLRTVVFQEAASAAAFARGWDCARGGARALRLL